MPANYDNIARIYDPLSRMVFGRSIIGAQVCMLGYIPPGSHILIAGGGTGWILEEISVRYPQGLEIDYVESSARMILLSQQKDFKQNKVNFIGLQVEDFVSDRPYDIVITPFIFDNFREEKIAAIFKKIDGWLKNNGHWLYADFVIDRQQSALWQKILLRVMYFFFRITTGIETQELVSMGEYFSRSYAIEFQAYHYFKFIKSVVYRKR